MERLQETPIKNAIEPTNSELDCKTPIEEDPKSQNSCNDLRKIGTPDPLKVPKAFKYPERYRSPTDLMVSPVTKGLLARNRRGGGTLLPPSINLSKVHNEGPAQDVISFKIEI